MAFSQTAARPLFSRNTGQTPIGVQMARQLRTGLRPAPDPTIVARPTIEDDGAAPTPPAARTVRPAPQMARPTTPNAGGTITAGGLTRAYAPSPASNPAINQGGTISRDLAPDVTAVTKIAPSVSARPARVAAPQQTEAANPLTGDDTTQPQDTTSAVDPASQAGFSSRGAAVPKGADSIGGTGLFQRKFSSPAAASAYDSYVRRLFGNEPEIA
jgi:hypothetical protein